MNVSDDLYRPMGLTEGPGGSLYISDTKKRKIWRVMFKGNKKNIGLAGTCCYDQTKNKSF